MDLQERADTRPHWKRDNPNAFMTHNFIEVTEQSRDRVVTSLTIRPETRNPYGVAHGSALYAMADNATGIAAHTDGRSYVTQSGNMYFLRNQTEGTLRAEATVIHRGRATCLVGVEITGDGGKTLASGTFVHFCVDRTVKPFHVREYSAPVESGTESKSGENGTESAPDSSNQTASHGGASDASGVSEPLSASGTLSADNSSAP